LKAVTMSENMQKRTLNNQDDLTLDANEENFYAGESTEKEDDSLHSDNAIYRVQKGESIYSIAAYFSISPETILGLNKISEQEIRPGTILEIPPVDGVYYEVRKGDTLAKLAEKYKIDLDDITLFNGLTENETLAVGDEVFIPGATPPKVEKKDNKKDTKNRNTDKNKNLTSKTKTGTIIDPVLGNLSKYIRYLGKGSTAQNSKLSDLKKYASLPKYGGYYTMPAPGTARTQTMHGHNGSDFAGKVGTSILAAAGGTVRVAKSSGYNFGYGNYVIITHPNGTETLYAHMSSVSVSVGQQVGQGQNIGAIGSSGNSTGPHLHFEIRGAYNPWAW
jgi:murein DD-endopeptidase MepM/ murein hydrolase activator NlpD